VKSHKLGEEKCAFCKNIFAIIYTINGSVGTLDEKYEVQAAKRETAEGVIEDQIEKLEINIEDNPDDTNLKKKLASLEEKLDRLQEKHSDADDRYQERCDNWQQKREDKLN